MKTIIPVAMTLLLAFSAQSSDPEITLVEKPKTTFKLDGKQGRVEIAANRERVPLGEEFSVRISFANLGDDPLPALDPMLTGVAGRYAILGIFNAQQEYVGDLLGTPIMMPRFVWPHHGLWCQIPPNKVFTIRKRFTAGAVVPSKFEHFPTGRYYIQLVVYGMFFSDSPWDLPCPDCGVDESSREYAEYLRRFVKAAEKQREATSEDRENPINERMEKWRKTNFGGVFVRSNVVTIELVAPPVEASMPR